jgi:hypothetical protein
MSDIWLTTLKTATPQEGYDLAIKLSRMAVKYTQPSAEMREKLRDSYANNADSLTAVSQVVATNFQTVAAANNYWNGGA